MKLVLVIVFVLFIVNIDAKRERDSNRPRRERNGDSLEGEGGDGSRKNSQNQKGYKSKHPFPLFKSCQDFNVAYSTKRKELKKNGEIWDDCCKKGVESEQEMCKSNGIKSIRCSLSTGPSEQCVKEINDFLNGIACDEAGGGETEDNGGNNDDTTEDTDEDFENEEEDIDGSTAAA